MSQFTDTIDRLIAEKNRAIKDLETEINALMAVKYMESPNSSSSYTVPTYRVPSRSGGKDHTVIYYGLYNTSCDCPAGKSYKKCWARKGIENMLHVNPNPHPTGNFFDEDMATRSYERIR